jgi:hypothetical protein
MVFVVNFDQISNPIVDKMTTMEVMAHTINIKSRKILFKVNHDQKHEVIFLSLSEKNQKNTFEYEMTRELNVN